MLGEENVIAYAPGMGGEDFSRFGREVPGFQFRLGVARPGAGPMSLHTSTFDPDERALALGIRLAAEIVWGELHGR